MTRQYRLNVGMVDDNMTRESCIPIDSVKSSEDYSILFHNIGIGALLIRIRPIRHTRLVGWKYPSQKRSGVIWIIIKIEKIVVISHITQEMSKINKENKQIHKKEKSILS